MFTTKFVAAILVTVGFFYAIGKHDEKAMSICELNNGSFDTCHGIAYR